MKNRQIVILVSIINLSLAAIFLLDSFVNRGDEFKTVKQKRIEKSSASRLSGRSHSTNILVDNFDHKYNIPKFAYDDLSIGDSIYVFVSAIFKRPNIIKYNSKGESVSIKVGVLNSSLFGVILCLVSIIIYSLLLFKPKIWGNPNYHHQIALFCTWILAIVGFFYYFFQP